MLTLQEKIMNKITLLFLFVLSLSFAQSQTYQPYTPFTTLNDGKLDYTYLRVDAGEPIYYLDYFNAGIIETYVLTDWEGSFANIPTIFNQMWTLRVTFSPCDKTMLIEFPNQIIKVRDSNQNEYVKLGQSN